MKIIGCEVFRKEFEHVARELAPELQNCVVWLPVGLHPKLDLLSQRLNESLEGVATQAPARLLYATCHPDIDEILEPFGAQRLPGKDCIDSFLTQQQRRELEGRRAMVITPGWLRNWRQMFVEVMGWDRADALQNFGFYDVVIVLDFGIETIDDMDVLEFFDYTSTPVELLPWSLDFFRERVRELLCP